MSGESYTVTPVSFHFGESSLDYICPKSPLQKYILLPTYVFPVSPLSLDSVSPRWKTYVR
jgi:hypothetical protein